jgi:AraC family transcriptional regulator
MKLLGEVRFQKANILAMSRDRGWAGIAADLRCHPAGKIPSLTAEQMEVTLAIQPDTHAVVGRLPASG